MRLSLQVRKRVRVDSHLWRRRLKRSAEAACELAARRKALLWNWLYIARHHCLLWQRQHGPIAVAAIVVLLIGSSFYLMPALQRLVGPHFATEGRLASLQSLLLTLGGALIGAAAIVSSFLMFAMQVNIERMPHGLFRRLVDWRLLSAVAATFLIAMGIASLSLVPGPQQVGITVFAGLWATVIFLALCLYGYRRALVLVNPVRQLSLVVRRTTCELRIWERRAKRAAPLFSGSLEGRDTLKMQQHDLPRAMYFQANPSWTDGALQGVRYAVAFARRYAEQGDNEVSAAAMTAIIAINSAYVEAKGTTFFSYHYMFDNPLTSDGFINDTLEHLRQVARVGVARADEEQIEQTLRAIARLVGVYLTIDYTSAQASKSHAHLAAGYLAGEVERLMPHKMPDVLMEGVRLVGQCADMLLSAEGPKGIGTLVRKIGTISAAGVAGEDFRPVTSTGVEQLARLDFNLLCTGFSDVRFAAREIRESMRLIAMLFMTVPDTPLASAHSAYLGPYYSATSTQALASRLTDLVNSVAAAPASDVRARQVIENFEEWSDGLYQTGKDLLLHAVEKRSNFTFDMIHWITTVTTLLLAVSNAAACREHTQRKLQGHAGLLIAVLSCVPGDKEAATFLENFQMTEMLFRSAVDARMRGCAALTEHIGKILLSWAFKAGRYMTGWGTLERSVYGLATLAVLSNAKGAAARLRAEIAAQIAAGALPDKEVCDHTALEIRRRAARLYEQAHWSSTIEQVMAQTDHGILQPLLIEIADTISPETKGQRVRSGFIDT